MVSKRYKMKLSYKKVKTNNISELVVPQILLSHEHFPNYKGRARKNSVYQALFSPPMHN